MPSTDKYCEDCKFCVRGSAPSFSKCSAPDAVQISAARFVARAAKRAPTLPTV